MNVALLNGSKHKTVYLSVQLPSKVSVLVDILNAVVCAAWKSVGLCMLHCSVIKYVEREVEPSPVTSPRETMKLLTKTNKES